MLARVRRRPTRYDAELWKALAADLGLAGLLVPEERGGAGASAREAAVVLEELGRAVAPVPFLTSAVVATAALLAAAGDGRRCSAGWPPASATAALAVPLADRAAGAVAARSAPTTAARCTGTGRPRSPAR